MMRYRLAAIPKTAIIVLLGVVISGGQPSGRDCLVIVLSCLQWVALYSLNESIDLVLEAGGSQGYWVVPICLAINACCIAGGYCAGGVLVAILFALMTMSQLVYCWPGVRTKRFVWAGPLQSGFVNPTLRFALGTRLGQEPDTDWQIVAICFALLIALHFAGALKTRVYQTSRDRQFGYQTISIAFAMRYIEPLQFLTPICAGGLIFLVFGMRESLCLPTALRIAVTLLATIGILTIWTINDIYDAARHRLGRLLIASYGGDLTEAESLAGTAIVRYEAEAGMPPVTLLRNLWHLRIPADLLVPGRFVLAALISVLMPVLPPAIAPFAMMTTLTVCRAITRPL